MNKSGDGIEILQDAKLPKYIHFDFTEYVVFVMMLAMSALIGVYYGWYKGNQNTVSEYMLGGKSMSVFPIAMSLVVSHISGITLLGLPAEIYYYGSQALVAMSSNILLIFVILVVYLPVFYNLQVMSANEYLELRFHSSIRKLASLIFGICLILIMPVLIYVPALAFNQVTGISIHVIAPAVCVVCIFYTTVGGLKAVVWTDTLQGLFFMAAIFTIIIIGLTKVGGLAEVLRVSNEKGRLEFFDMDPNPFKRMSFWSTMVGSIFFNLAHLGTHPGSVQRFISLPSLRHAKWSAVYLILGVIVISILSALCGVIIFTKYNDCDPLATNIISRPDQLVPHFVMDVAGSYRGLPGLFLAGIVSSALGSTSAALNTLAGMIFEDFVKPLVVEKYSDAAGSHIMKVTVVVLGTICVIMVFLVEKLSTIFHLTLSFTGITNGAFLGLFTLGMLFPWANTKGALCGAVTSIVTMIWIVSGAQLAILRGDLKFETLPVTTDNCSFNVTNRNSTLPYKIMPVDNVFILYKLSFFYYVLTGCCMVIITGLIVSFITGPNDASKMDRNVFSPVIHRFLPTAPATMDKEMYTTVPTTDTSNHVKSQNDTTN